MKKFTILLPFQEILNSFFGGAIARWVNEVYRSSEIFNLDIKVCGMVALDSNDYNELKIISKNRYIFLTLMKIPLARRILSLLYCFLYRKEILDSDLIEIHNSYEYIKYIRFLGYKGKLILHMHNDYLSKINNSEFRFIENQISVLVVCSNHLAERIFSKFKNVSCKIEVIYNGVNFKLFHPNQSKKDTNTIGYVGRIEFNKGLHRLLEVYKIIIQKIPNIRLQIIGSSSFGKIKQTAYEKKCITEIQYINNNLGGNIELVGYVHHKDLKKWFNQFTLFCSLPIENEAFGMTFIESLACKTPVLGTNVGGISESIGFSDMIISKDSSANDLSEKILYLISNKNILANLAEAGYKRVINEFDWSIIRFRKAKILCQYH